jgi:hypothetical protein
MYVSCLCRLDLKKNRIDPQCVLVAMLHFDGMDPQCMIGGHDLGLQFYQSMI